MKLLLDQNLSFKLVAKLADLFPQSQQVGGLGLDQADDRSIWDYAKANGFVLNEGARSCARSDSAGPALAGRCRLSRAAGGGKIAHAYIVTKDADFAALATLLGTPPKVIWLRCGNEPTPTIERLLRDHASTIEAFTLDDEADCLEIHQRPSS